MTNMEASGEDQILKVDTRGRVRVSRQRRGELLAEYDRSSMSAAAFAEWAGIKYPTFAWWLQERRRDQRSHGGAEEGGKTLSWVEAVVDNGGDGSRDPRAGQRSELGLVIALPGGVRMEVGDRVGAELAAEVLRQLGGGARC